MATMILIVVDAIDPIRSVASGVFIVLESLVCGKKGQLNLVFRYHEAAYLGFVMSGTGWRSCYSCMIIYRVVYV